MIDKQTALRRLLNRYIEQCERFPTLRYDVPVRTYLDTNLQHVMENDLLADYDEVQS